MGYGLTAGLARGIEGITEGITGAITHRDQLAKEAEERALRVRQLGLLEERERREAARASREIAEYDRKLGLRRGLPADVQAFRSLMGGQPTTIPAEALVGEPAGLSPDRPLLFDTGDPGDQGAPVAVPGLHTAPMTRTRPWGSTQEALASPEAGPLFARLREATGASPFDPRSGLQIETLETTRERIKSEQQKTDVQALMLNASVKQASRDPQERIDGYLLEQRALALQGKAPSDAVTKAILGDREKQRLDAYLAWQQPYRQAAVEGRPISVAEQMNYFKGLYEYRDVPAARQQLDQSGDLITQQAHPAVQAAQQYARLRAQGRPDAEALAVVLEGNPVGATMMLTQEKFQPQVFKDAMKARQERELAREKAAGKREGMTSEEREDANRLRRANTKAAEALAEQREANAILARARAEAEPGKAKSDELKQLELDKKRADSDAEKALADQRRATAAYTRERPRPADPGSMTPNQARLRLNDIGRELAELETGKGGANAEDLPVLRGKLLEEKSILEGVLRQKSGLGAAPELPSQKPAEALTPEEQARRQGVLKTRRDNLVRTMFGERKTWANLTAEQKAQVAERMNASR